MLVPANRFEVLECRAALDADSCRRAGHAAAAAPARSTCWPSTCSGMACAEPFDADELYDEVRSAAPYADLDRGDFDACVDFVATGGYALRSL